MSGRPPADATISWASDYCLRIGLGSDTSIEAHRRVRAACDRLRAARLPALRDITPAYSTVLVSFVPLSVKPSAVEKMVEDALRDLKANADDAASRLVEIPVCYEGECAPDIGEVARLHDMSAQEVAALHCGAAYIVHFIGFSPGFAYMGGLPARLVTPRLDTPRIRVPRGSVGIAGDQTGVYPHATPGGWRLIGRTPLRMFDAAVDPPSLLAMGDRVRFVPISLDRFRATHSGGA